MSLQLIITRGKFLKVLEFRPFEPPWSYTWSRLRTFVQKSPESSFVRTFMCESVGHRSFRKIPLERWGFKSVTLFLLNESRVTSWHISIPTLEKSSVFHFRWFTSTIRNKSHILTQSHHYSSTLLRTGTSSKSTLNGSKIYTQRNFKTHMRINTSALSEIPRRVPLKMLGTTTRLVFAILIASLLFSMHRINTFYTHHFTAEMMDQSEMLSSPSKSQKNSLRASIALYNHVAAPYPRVISLK